MPPSGNPGTAAHPQSRVLDDRGQPPHLDWSFDEDRSRIRTGHGPNNMTRLRRFAIGLIQARGLGVAETMRKLARNPRRVLDFLKMTGNTPRRAAPARPSLGAAPFTRAANPRQTGAVAHVRMPE